LNIAKEDILWFKIWNILKGNVHGYIQENDFKIFLAAVLNLYIHAEKLQEREKKLDENKWRRAQVLADFWNPDNNVASLSLFSRVCSIDKR